MNRPRPVAVAGTLVLAIVGFAPLLALGCGGSSSSSSGGGGKASPRASDAKAASKRFLKRYVTPDGRVSRLDQGRDTVGEGQAYGMLIAAAVGDQKRFASIWGWTQDNIRRPDGLLSFLWRSGRVVDPQAASDADVDAARALLVASCRFSRPEYRDEAIKLGKAILAKESSPYKGERVLTAGPWANKPVITVNPSYFSPATFAALSAATGDATWDGLAASSRSITGELMQARSPLPPDWARLEGSKPVPIGSPGNPKDPPRFGFDAVRTLVRMAEDPDPEGRKIAARAWRVFEGQDPDNLPVEHELSGKPAGDSLHPVVLVAAAGAADAAGDASGRDLMLDAAEDLDRRSPTYYGAALVALGRLFLTTDALKPCG